MNMRETVRAIEDLIAEMQIVTLESGVPKATYDKISAVSNDLTLEELEERLAFLLSVRQNEYHGVHKIWRLLPPEMWVKYTLLGQTKLREQVLLKSARSKLRKVWRLKYGERKTTESDKDPTGPDGVGLRSEDPESDVGGGRVEEA